MTAPPDRDGVEYTRRLGELVPVALSHLPPPPDSPERAEAERVADSLVTDHGAITSTPQAKTIAIAALANAMRSSTSELALAGLGLGIGTDMVHRLGDSEYVLVPKDPQYPSMGADVLRVDELDPTDPRHASGQVVPMDDPHAEMLVRQIAVSELMDAWGYGSNNNIRALALQEVAEQEFGLGNALGWLLDSSEAKRLETELSYNREALRDFLRTQYTLTQEFLADSGVTHVIMYRTMTWSESAVVPAWAEGDVGEVTDVAERPLASWTSDRATAAAWLAQRGGRAAILVSLRPAREILAVPRTGIGFLGQKEIVALAGESAVLLDGSFDATPATGEQTTASAVSLGAPALDSGTALDGHAGTRAQAHEPRGPGWRPLAVAESLDPADPIGAQIRTVLDGREDAPSWWPRDDSGYEITRRDLEYLRIDPVQVKWWATGESPLGMTPDLYRAFGSELLDALAGDGIDGSQVDIRLKGSSADFFSGLHKVLPRPAEVAGRPDAARALQEWAGDGGRLPLRRPYDAMWRIGMDSEPSDFDLDINSSAMVRAARAHWLAHSPGRYRGDFMGGHGYVDKATVLASHPALAGWVDRWEAVLGRPVSIGLFESSGPFNAALIGRALNSGFKDSDWIIHRSEVPPGGETPRASFESSTETSQSAFDVRHRVAVSWTETIDARGLGRATAWIRDWFTSSPRPQSVVVGQRVVTHDSLLPHAVPDPVVTVLDGAGAESVRASAPALSVELALGGHAHLYQVDPGAVGGLQSAVLETLGGASGSLGRSLRGPEAAAAVRHLLSPTVLAVQFGDLLGGAALRTTVDHAPAGPTGVIATELDVSVVAAELRAVAPTRAMGTREHFPADFGADLVRGTDARTRSTGGAAGHDLGGGDSWVHLTAGSDRSRSRSGTAGDTDSRSPGTLALGGRTEEVLLTDADLVVQVTARRGGQVFTAHARVDHVGVVTLSSWAARELGLPQRVGAGAVPAEGATQAPPDGSRPLGYEWLGLVPPRSAGGVVASVGTSELGLADPVAVLERLLAGGSFSPQVRALLRTEAAALREVGDLWAGVSVLGRSGEMLTVRLVPAAGWAGFVDGAVPHGEALVGPARLVVTVTDVEGVQGATASQAVGVAHRVPGSPDAGGPDAGGLDVGGSDAGSTGPSGPSGPRHGGGRRGDRGPLDWVDKPNPLTGMPFSSDPDTFTAEAIRQWLLNLNDVGAVLKTLRSAGVTIGREDLELVKRYLFDSAGIVFTRENFDAWRRLATGTAMVKDVQFLVHEHAELVLLQAEKGRTGFDYLGRGVEAMTDKQKKRWEARFDTVYRSAHQRALEVEYAHLAKTVRRLSGGDVTVSWLVAAVADGRDEGRNWLVVDGLPMSEHQDYVAWVRQADDPARLRHRIRAQLFPARLWPEGGGPTVREVVQAVGERLAVRGD